VKILILIAAIVTVGFVIITLVAVRPRKAQQHIVYKLEGPVGSTVIVTTDGANRETVRLPWTFGFWKPRGTSVELDAQFWNDSEKGSIDAKVFLDGQLLQSARASGTETAKVRVTIP
jgi:hypothetical protein